MKTCPYCHHDVASDAMFCVHCGKPIEKQTEKIEKKLNKKERTQIKSMEVKKEKAPKNLWWTFAILLFLIGLVVFDGIMAIIFNEAGWSYKIVFMLSACLYVFAIICSTISLLTDSKATKNNLEPTGNTIASIAVIAMSLYVMLVNIQQIILK